MLSRFGKKLANLKLFFWCCLWLFVLLVIGTVAQKDIGLYQAQMKYFSSWIFWVGFIPLPGAWPTMGMILIGLIAQLIFKTQWKKLSSYGIAITHLGAVLLLLGGVLTGLYSQEGNMIIPEGESADFFKEYHARELSIIDPTPNDHDAVIAIGEDLLNKGKSIQDTKLPFEIEVLNYYGNIAFKKRPEGQGMGYVGFANRFILEEKALDKQEERNVAGLIFKVRGSDRDGVYAVFERMQIPQSVTVKGKKYYVELENKKVNLPFRLELIDFKKESYAATSMARSYSSALNLIDGEVKQRVLIKMNEPLRYKGYTFYQASFAQDQFNETSILAVVKNSGELFPYISSIVMCIGILIHLFLKLPVLFREKKS